jgi:hypothetical protein
MNSDIPHHAPKTQIGGEHEPNALPLAQLGLDVCAHLKYPTGSFLSCYATAASQLGFVTGPGRKTILVQRKPRVQGDA